MALAIATHFQDVDVAFTRLPRGKPDNERLNDPAQLRWIVHPNHHFDCTRANPHLFPRCSGTHRRVEGADPWRGAGVTLHFDKNRIGCVSLRQLRRAAVAGQLVDVAVLAKRALLAGLVGVTPSWLRPRATPITRRSGIVSLVVV